MKNIDNTMKMPGGVTKYTVISNDGRYTITARETLDGTTKFTDLEEVLYSPKAMGMLLPCGLSDQRAASNKNLDGVSTAEYQWDKTTIGPSKMIPPAKFEVSFNDSEDHPNEPELNDSLPENPTEIF